MLRTTLANLVQECEYSASSGLPFNFPEGRGHWTQLEKAKAVLGKNLVSKFIRRKSDGKLGWLDIARPDVVFPHYTDGEWGTDSVNNVESIDLAILSEAERNELQAKFQAWEAHRRTTDTSS